MCIVGSVVSISRIDYISRGPEFLGVRMHAVTYDHAELHKWEICVIVGWGVL